MLGVGFHVLTIVVEKLARICNERVHIAGVHNIEACLKKQELIVDTSLPSAVVLEAIESTGRRAVLYGQGALNGVPHTSSAQLTCCVYGSLHHGRHALFSEQRMASIKNSVFAAR